MASKSRFWLGTGTEMWWCQTG